MGGIGHDYATRQGRRPLAATLGADPLHVAANPAILNSMSSSRDTSRRSSTAILGGLLLLRPARR